MNSVDLIVYYPHADDASEAAAARNVVTIRQAFPNIPLVLLSDAEDAEQPRTLRSALKSGAHGFIPPKTGIAVTVAAIRFVKAGGTFAPLELLMAARQVRLRGSGGCQAELADLTADGCSFSLAAGESEQDNRT